MQGTPASLPGLPGRPDMPAPNDQRAQYSQLVRDLADVMQLRFWDHNETATRRQLAGVDFMPIPSWSYRAVAPGNNSVIDIVLPDALSLIAFSALDTVEYYVSFGGGRVAMPAVASNPSGSLVTNDGFRPQNGRLFYCRNVRQVSVGIAANAAVVSIMGVQQAG